MTPFANPLELLAAADRCYLVPKVQAPQKPVRSLFEPLTRPDLVPMQPLSQPLGNLQTLMDSIAKDPLDPEYPDDLVNETLRAAGIDPDEVAEKIRTFRALPDAIDD